LEDSLQQEEQYQNSKVKGCILPWVHLYGCLGGTYHLCCHAEFNAKNPVVLGTHEDRLLNIWNGNPIKKIRNEFLQGETPVECVEACYDMETKGGISNRQQVNKRFEDKSFLQEKTNPDGSVNNYPSYVDIRFGNLCNFKCRICGPYASTSWYKDANYKGGTIDFYTNNENMWEDLKLFLPSIEDIYFAGGEPFVQDGHYKLLNMLIDSGNSHRVSLQYNTNLSYSKFKKFDLKKMWSSFKDVSLWPSIEGWKEQAEYSRKGLNWKKFASNVYHFQDHITTFSSVISIFSIYTMPELILWCKRIKKSYYGNMLQQPSYYNITCLPTESKKMIVAKYKKFIYKNVDLLHEYEIKQMLKWLKYMNSVDNSHLLKQFKEKQERLDKLREESFETVYPEYAEWYKNI